MGEGGEGGRWEEKWFVVGVVVVVCGDVVVVFGVGICPFALSWRGSRQWTATLTTVTVDAVT